MKPPGSTDAKKNVLSFSGNLKISSMERELARSYAQTCEAEKTIFDLTQVSWIGYMPAALLLNWTISLVKMHGKHVEFITQPYDEMTNQVRATLLGQGIMDRVEEIGAKVSFVPPPTYRRGQPLTPVTSINDLWETLQETAQTIVRSQKLEVVTDRVLRDAFQTILYELVENAYVHTKAAYPIYGISLARAGESMKRAAGFMSPFEAGSDYLEVYVGDLGRGLEASLQRSMPKDYLPPFGSTHEFTKVEKVLAYAFEFSSTSDVEGRLNRLHNLLTSDLDPSHIATGLYCVAELARSLAGQFLVRTPKAILSFKFFPERYEPEVKGKKELGIKNLAALPGTHYLVRLPLTVTPTKKWIQARTEFKPSIPTRVVDIFRTVKSSDSIESHLQYAITGVDEYLIKNRQSRQLVIILPARFPLPSRAEALFIAAVGRMTHGRCLVLWLNKHARFTTEPNTAFALGVSGQALLVGDLFSNNFRSFGNTDPRWNALLDAESPPDIHLTEEVLGSIRAEVRRALDEVLKQALSGMDVKHSGDSFLLEGQYYTETFFEIDKAWENPENVRLFAEWALTKLSPNVDVLIAHAAPVFPMVNLLGELMKEYLGVEPVIITHELDESPAKTISSLVSLSGHHAVIVTDVICTADRLRRFLNLVAGVEIDGILALVDGRTDEPEQPIPWLMPAENRFLQIQSILTEKIEVYPDPPKRSRRTLDNDDIEDEQVYVIDRRTRAPTLYVRPAKPQLKFEKLLKGPVKETKSLLRGHTEFRGKHYLYFLQFPKLFEYLHPEIMNWVTNQINYVERSSKTSGQPWNAYVYNPDESLLWMIDALPQLRQKPSVRSLNYEQLKAPSPPRQGDSSGNWIIVLPALASGETARLCLEYVSRHNPASMLLLCIASRMEPYHLTFFTRVNRYGDADLHTACFMEFPVPSFAIGRGTCPQCTELARLTELRDIVRNFNKKSSNLLDAMERTIAANQAVPLGVELEDNWLSREPSPDDNERAYIRALYEAAFVNIEIRRKLNALLSRDIGHVDRFLEVLSVERYNEQFSKEALNSILYKADAAVRNRLLEIISEEKPPLPIGRFMGAILHLLPHVFVSNAVLMLNRYSKSQRDVEEICIGLLQVGIEPSGLGEFFEFFRSDSSHETMSTLFTETLDILRATQDKDRHAFSQSIEATVQLWAQLVRSSQFSEPISGLAQTPIDRYLGDDEIEELVEQISLEWKNRIIELITKIQSGPLWPKLKSRRPQVPIAVTRLESSIAKLELLVKSDRGSLFGSTDFIVNVHARAKEVQHACREIAAALYSFFTNPVMCSAAQLSKTLVTTDGSQLSVSKKIDQTVPRVFCTREDLESICGQLIGNWKKHKTSGKRGTKVEFKIYSTGGEVVLEFSDDIEGDFDLQSRGGLAVVRECCQEYGGLVKVELEHETKTISLFLRSVNAR
jgi:ABC-type transporter Mla MlaB component